MLFLMSLGIGLLCGMLGALLVWMLAQGIDRPPFRRLFKMPFQKMPISGRTSTHVPMSFKDQFRA